MHELKLTYFDVHGGRGEAARLAMRIADIPFEDVRFTFAEFGEVRKTTPLGQVPTLFVDGRQVTQCNAINRFVGKLAGLYPQDPVQALLCDEVMDALEDVGNKFVATFGLQGEALKAAREALVAGPITQYLKWTEALIGDRYFVGDSLTIVDLKVFVWTNGLNSGFFDHIPTSLVEDVAPKLAAHNRLIASLPAISAYYAG